LHTYECEACNQSFEIEEIEAVLSPPEHYEHGQCKSCFERVEQ
jgi:hypothetical protein